MQAISHDNNEFNIKEPFKGLFTQGMVCHETYKDYKNNWVSPEDIETIEGKKYLFLLYHYLISVLIFQKYFDSMSIIFE